jgi:putative ABC transport system permease protein
MTGYVFMSHAATDELLRSPDTTSFILVASADPETVEASLASQDLTVLPRSVLAANDRDLTTGVFGSPITVMTSVAFVTGVLVVALTTYTAVIERRREYGVLSALGAPGRLLIGVVLSQGVMLALTGFMVGAGLFVLARMLLDALRPQFTVTLTDASVWRALVSAFVMAMLAAWMPARRLVSAEPATVYRGTS